MSDKFKDKTNKSKDKSKDKSTNKLINKLYNIIDNKVWSTTFKKYVDGIDGYDIYDKRVLIKLESGKLIDVPLSWTNKIN